MCVDDMIRLLLVALLLYPTGGPAHAGQDRRVGISGAWQCNQLCQAANRVATISANQSDIECKNERGDLWRGTRVSSRAFNCFNTLATLSDDGETIVWSNGVVWRRNHLQEF